MVTLQQCCQYVDLSDGEFLGICKAFGAQGVARAFDKPMAEVEARRKRAERGQAEKGRRQTDEHAEMAKPKDLLERMQTKCTALMLEIEGMDDPATQLELLEKVRKFEQTLSETARHWLGTEEGVEKLKRPVMELPPALRDKVLGEWSRASAVLRMG